jgi:putative FmdB family regulatory protein
MPIYEYKAVKADQTCDKCREGFEILQGINEKPLLACPVCGKKVKKLISWCRSAVIEQSQEDSAVAERIKKFEKSGMWSHAAELADNHSEKTKDKKLKTRALENYKKAGYDADSLSGYSKNE